MDRTGGTGASLLFPDFLFGLKSAIGQALKHCKLDLFVSKARHARPELNSDSAVGDTTLVE